MSGSVHAQGTSTSLKAGRALLAGTRLEVGRGGALTLAWAGRRSVRLDQGTSARLEDVSRLVLQRGALYIDSGSGEATAVPGRLALEVETPLGSVVPLGTQFEARLASDAGVVLRVRVREGSVTILRPDRFHTVGAGEQLVVRPDGLVEKSKIDPNGPDWDWVR